MDKILTYNDYKNGLDGRGDIFVFRGQANSDFVLIPSGLREQHRKTADAQMFCFVDEMRRMFDFDELTCIEIAQHFALPTRMLDFSYSFDVALFFACHEMRGRYADDDGKVFIFNKSRYEQMLKDKKKLSSEVIRNNKYLYEWLQKYIDKVPTAVGEGVDMPIFIDATQQFDRLYMQKGLFLLWGQDECPFEEIINKEELQLSQFVDTLVIDRASKPALLEELAKKHMCEDTLYMNVSKIKQLVNNIKDDAKDGKVDMYGEK